MSAVKPSDAFSYRSSLEAALILAIGMGFGRFAFTAIYPYMVSEGVLSLHAGSLAASANYAGYLLGAVVAIRAQFRNAHHLCLWAIAGTTLCLAVPGFTASPPIIIMVRALAGVFSALSMIAASLWLLECRRHSRGAPLLYAGVGIGIVLSAELLVLGTRMGLRSAGLWLSLAAVSATVGLLIVPGLMRESTAASPDAAEGSATPALVRQWPLVLLYGLAGFGYIVTATYLPLLVHIALPDLKAAHVWAVFGLGAVPSCFLWHRLHERLGTRAVLCTNLAIQAGGVLSPVLLPSSAGYLLSALLVGGTFMGTVTIVMPAAQRIGRISGTNLIARMTLMYGVGQIAGPMVTNAMYAWTGGFAPSLMAAGAALTAAALISLLAL